jgi:Ca2+-binding EF-hand superfamily protein
VLGPVAAGPVDATPVAAGPVDAKPDTEEPMTGAETGAETGELPLGSQATGAGSDSTGSAATLAAPIPVVNTALTGPAATGVASTGPAATGVASTGPAATGPSTESKWDRIKRLYDANKDNKVSWAELIKAEPKLNTEHMKKVFQKIGASNTLASYNDYMKFLLESKVSPKLPNTGSKWDTIKRLYNENKDNKVSWAELIKAEPNLNTEHMKKVFKQIAGADGLASYNDYAKFISKADKAVKPKETLWERVRRLYDENKDSKVSWKELIRAQPKLNNWRMRRTFKSIAVTSQAIWSSD